MATGVLDRGFWAEILLVPALLIILVFLPDVVLAGGGPRDVAVVINTRSAVSREIANYYQAARKIPASNICYISCPDQEVVSKDVCERLIREPIRRFLNQPGIAGKIDFIVLTKGVPLSADYGELSGPYSVTSILTCVDQPEYQEGIPSPYGPIATVQFSAPAPEVAWSHSLSFDDQHFFLVTRLDAFTEEQVKNMIDRSAAPGSSGTFILDKNTIDFGVYKAANTRLGDQAGSAYAYLTMRAYPVAFDYGTSFIAGLHNVRGYFSWAANDNKYSFQAYVSNDFAPGSVGDTYYSFSSRTFKDPGSTQRGPLIADLIAKGLCGAGGYVSEPYIDAATYPNILFDRYTKGYNMAESFYAACPSFFWKTTIAGDPLMAPYATPPVVSLQVPSLLEGVVTIGADAQDASGVSKVRFYIDDEMIGEDTQYPFDVKLDTTNYSVGSHTIEAIAFENSPVATQGSIRKAITVTNYTSAVSQIGQALVYPDGQSVRLTAKTVIAGTMEVGGSFFIEESDRSSAIRVFSGQNVSRGDMVTLTGLMGTWLGQRIIMNAAVTVVGTGAMLPKPLLIRVDDLGGITPGPTRYCVKPGHGAGSISRLVRVVGRISHGPSGVTLITDNSAEMPVKVYGSAATGLSDGVLVALTGICTIDAESDQPQAALLIRDAVDVQVLCWDCPVSTQSYPSEDQKPGISTGFIPLPPMP